MSHDHGHDHTHEPDPVEQLAFKELSARYGILFGDMTRADTKVQILMRREAALRERLGLLEQFLSERGMIDHEGLPVDVEPGLDDEASDD